MKTALITCLAALTVLAGCDDGPAAQRGEKSASAQIVPFGCTEDGVRPYRVDALSILDEVEVCNAIQASAGKLPSVQFFQDMSKAVVAFKIKGSKDDARELSYQLMNIIEARGQSDADDATKYGTVNIVFKMYNGWNGRITPKDVNVFLRRSGEAGQKLSDDGLVGMMALVLQEKKAAGE